MGAPFLLLYNSYFSIALAILVIIVAWVQELDPTVGVDFAIDSLSVNHPVTESSKGTFLIHFEDLFEPDLLVILVRNHEQASHNSVLDVTVVDT